MEFRESAVVEVRADKREIVGIAVPYDQIAEIRTSAGSYKEKFLKGAIEDNIEAPVYFRHDHQSNGLSVGSILSAISTDAGLEVTTKIYRSSKGDQVLNDAMSGKLKNFSIGFNPLEHQEIDGITVRTKVSLEEVSLVESPAYAGAAVIEIRESNNKKEDDEQIMSIDNDNLSTEVAGLRDSVTDLERKLEVLEVREESAPATNYRSGGEWLKALAAGSEDARMEVRAFTGATTVDADTIRPAWMNEQLKLVQKQRIVKSLFSSESLPSTGNSIEYPYVKTETGTVGVQSAEGADLPYLELVIDTATAPVVTHGGYSSLSRQSIERSDVAYLESVLRFQAIQYGNSTEAAVQSALAAASGVNTIELGGATAAAKQAAQYLEAVIDAKAAIDDNSKGLTADVILVSRDVHKKMSLIVDTTGRPVFALNGDGVNTFGTIPGGRLAGVIDGTPMVVGKNLAAGTIVVASSLALTSYESPGAPFALQDENIINLTKDFSLYGYFATAIKDAKGISRIVDAV